MNLILNILLLTTFFLLVNGQEQNKKPLQVTVLYESLCPDSVNFFQYQLGPNYDYIKDFIDISLVPFGKSKSFEQGGQFVCQHGPPECEGNRIQSCALHQTDNQEIQVKFATCQMAKQAERSGKQCTQQFGIPYEEVDVCMKTEIGTVFQLTAEAITNSIDLKFVPTIVYDNVFDQQLQDRSQNEFLPVVCELLTAKGIKDPKLSRVCS